MTREELATYDGRNGRRAYVAVNGKIYDFTDSPMWPGGDHQGAHQAGCDLSEALLGAPHVRAVIERFPVVGELT
ncbi:MAG: cytochrome B5, partial [Desulfuromonadales bacterium]|nr:cytochrome B5 [Desulfuromonadales bacterium]